MHSTATSVFANARASAFSELARLLQLSMQIYSFATQPHHPDYTWCATLLTYERCFSVLLVRLLSVLCKEALPLLSNVKAESSY